MINEDRVQSGIAWLRETQDDEDVLCVVEAAEAFLALSDELERPGGLSEKDRATLRGWAESAAHRPKTTKSRWVAQKVLRLLRENFNMKARS